VLLYLPFTPNGESTFWSQLVNGVRGARSG